MATKNKKFKKWLDRGFISVERSIDIDEEEREEVDIFLTICDGSNVVRLGAWGDKNVNNLIATLRKAADTMEGK